MIRFGERFINPDHIVFMEAVNEKTLGIKMTNGEVLRSEFKTAECMKAFLNFIARDAVSSEKIRIKYHTDMEKLAYIDGKSDWIDLRAAEKVELKAGEFKLINLGVSMKVPDGYEAHLVPRSSTFKNYGILQTNSIGIIDNSYSGDNDIWRMPAYATRDTVIEKGDRICQFRIVKNQPQITFEETDHLDGNDRGGFGSTGVS